MLTLLWFSFDSGFKKLETVEEIVETKRDYDHHCSAEVFKFMKNLRLLEVKGRFTSSEPTEFSQQLRWLCWTMYPYESLKITDVSELVGLEMIFGWIQLQLDNKIILPNLKFMDLRGSLSITRFPDISVVPNLEGLNLSRCSELVEVHPSVLLHGKIIHLDLSSCISLEMLPSTIQMISLQTLRLNLCRSLDTFPEVLSEMRSLLLLNIDGCDLIRKLPSSTRLLTGLTVMCMERIYQTRSYFRRQRQGLRIQRSIHLSSLKNMCLKSNKLEEYDFHANLDNVWPSLEELDLRENMFTRLPKSISQLSHLKYLNLSDCIILKELPELPSLI